MRFSIKQTIANYWLLRYGIKRISQIHLAISAIPIIIQLDWAENQFEP